MTMKPPAFTSDMMAPATPSTPEVATVELRIKGMEVVNNDTIRLRGIKQINVNWPVVADILKDAGITEPDSYIEMFAGRVHKMELAKALAELVTVTNTY